MSTDDQDSRAGGVDACPAGDERPSCADCYPESPDATCTGCEEAPEE